MLVLNAGAHVTQLRFLPDSRLLVGTWAAGDATLAIWPLSDGPIVHIPLPYRQVWDAPNQLAVLPPGDRLVTAFGGLVTVSTADGRELSDGPTGPANEVIVSPDGQRLVVAHREANGDTILTGYTAASEGVRLGTFISLLLRTHLAAYLPGGEDFAVVCGNTLYTSRFAVGTTEPVANFTTTTPRQTMLSPDGLWLGTLGRSRMYVYDTAEFRTPRLITRRSGEGGFVGFAFHPAGKTLAVIHGGPTLVKLYDLDTLKLRTKLNWKVGPLTCVAFSADGLLGAAGTDDGRVVVWDVDE